MIQITAKMMAISGALTVVPVSVIATGNVVLPPSYRKEAILGEGGFGAVFKVTTAFPLPGDRSFVNRSADTSAGDRYTYGMKMVKGGLSNANNQLQNAKNQLQNERKLLIGINVAPIKHPLGWRNVWGGLHIEPLKHKNIVSAYYYDQSEEGDKLFIEYLSGGSLEDIVNKSPMKALPFSSAMSAISDVAEGLAYMESRKAPVVHSDIKPGNILLEQPLRFQEVTAANPVPKVANARVPTAKISDFGGARYESNKCVAWTNLYAPLDNQEKCQLSGKFDVWSLGLTLLAALGGQKNDYEGMKLVKDNFRKEWNLELEAEKSGRRVARDARATVALRKKLIDHIFPAAQNATVHNLFKEIVMGTLEPNAEWRWSPAELVEFIQKNKQEIFAKKNDIYSPKVVPTVPTDKVPTDKVPTEKLPSTKVGSKKGGSSEKDGSAGPKKDGSSEKDGSEKGSCGCWIVVAVLAVVFLLVDAIIGYCIFCRTKGGDDTDAVTDEETETLMGKRGLVSGGDSDEDSEDDSESSDDDN